MNVPAELRYTKDHEWLRLESGDVAVVGITDFAQSELGELVYVDVFTVGNTLKAGEVFGAVEAVKTTSDLFMPVDGEVLEFNPALEDNNDGAALINEDPYGKGWIVKIKVANLADLDNLLDAPAYQNHIA